MPAPAPAPALAPAPAPAPAPSSDVEVPSSQSLGSAASPMAAAAPCRAAASLCASPALPAAGAGAPKASPSDVRPCTACAPSSGPPRWRSAFALPHSLLPAQLRDAPGSAAAARLWLQRGGAATLWQVAAAFVLPVLLSLFYAPGWDAAVFTWYATASRQADPSVAVYFAFIGTIVAAGAAGMRWPSVRRLLQRRVRVPACLPARLARSRLCPAARAEAPSQQPAHHLHHSHHHHSHHSHAQAAPPRSSLFHLGVASAG